AAPLRDPRGAARSAARARTGARPDADGARPRRAPRPHPIEVPLLAYVRVAECSAPRGGLRRRGRRGAPGARDRTGGGGGTRAAPAAEVRRLGRPPARAAGDAHRVAGLPAVRVPPGRLG